jgi:hypothetical protein
MKYFKLFVLWLVFITLITLFGEYIISREVNGFIQLLCFVGVVGLGIFIVDKTINLIQKKND